MIYRSWIRWPRWAGMSEVLWQIAAVTGVQFTLEHESKGLLQTTLFWKVEGEAEQVQRFMAILEKAVGDYNAPPPPLVRRQGE